jgi:hypothetical protein
VEGLLRIDGQRLACLRIDHAVGVKARGLRSPTRDRDDLEEEGTGAAGVARVSGITSGVPSMRLYALRGRLQALHSVAINLRYRITLEMLIDGQRQIRYAIPYGVETSHGHGVSHRGPQAALRPDR